MIIANAAVNIDENLKLAQEAKDNAESEVDKATGKFSSILDGKITQSQYAPDSAGDSHDHHKGDLWVETSGTGWNATATAMYIFDGSSWQQKKWDQQSLSVKTLSALTADLGTVNSGTLNSVDIYAHNLTLDVSSDNYSYDDGHNSRSWSGYVSQGMGVNFNHGLMHMNATSSRGGYDATYIGPNDIKVRNTSGLDPKSYLYGRVDIDSTGIVVGNSWNDLKESHMNADGGIFVGGELNSNDGIKAGGVNDGYSQNCTIAPSTGMDIYFHTKSNNSTVNIHAGDVISHGHTLSSTLSTKRNITDISGEEALAKVNATDIKRWQYKDDDNGRNHIGPVIDNVNEVGKKEYSTPSDMVATIDGETGLDQGNALSLALASIQELSRRNDELSLKILQLEGKLKC